MSRRARALLVAAAAAVVVVALVVSALVSGGEDTEPSSAPSTSATPEPAPVVPLSEVDTLTAAVTRDTFCDEVAPDAVEAALGGPATSVSEYADGESAQVTGRVRDIVHEYGCAWTTANGGARAWVFAPPVTRRTAESLARSARQDDGCRPVAGAPDFGSPSVALTCRTSRGLETSYRGLFGDAWLTCTLTDQRVRARSGTPVDEVVARTERWCVAVLAAVAP